MAEKNPVPPNTVEQNLQEYGPETKPKVAVDARMVYEESTGHPFEEQGTFYNLAPHVNITFEETFRESKEDKGFPFTLKINRILFQYINFYVYAVFGLILGPVLVIVWAIVFAILEVIVVLLMQPLIKGIFMFYRVISMLFNATINLFCDPLFTSISLSLSGIKGRFQMNDTDINVNLKTGQIKHV